MGLRRLRLLGEQYPERHARPKTRSECEDGIRPCPFVSCKFHLYLDVQQSGSIKFNFPDIEPDEMAFSCALDIAERGGITLEELGEYMNLTRERIRQVEWMAINKLMQNAEQVLREMEG